MGALFAPTGHAYGPIQPPSGNEYDTQQQREPRRTRMYFRSASSRLKKLVTTGLIGAAYSGAVFADDVSGSDSLLCYGLSAARLRPESSST